MSSITLHNLDPRLEAEIRARAKERGESLNRTIQKLLVENLGLGKAQAKKGDFSDLCGVWSEEDYREFEEAAAGFRVADPKDFDL